MTHRDQGPTEPPPPSRAGGDRNARVGTIDIVDRPGKGKIRETSEDSCTASDPPSSTPPGAVDAPPRRRK